MKHSVSFLLAMILLLAMSTTAIAQETAEGFQYRVETDGTVTITGYSGNGGKMSIPSEVEGVAVRTIGNGAFVNNSTISSVYVPEGVTHIGNGVFNNCSGLVNIELPTTLVSIGEGAFEACGSLARIRIPNNITRFCIVKYIAHDGFIRNFSVVAVCIVNRVILAFADICGKGLPVVIICRLIIGGAVLSNKILNERIWAGSVIWRAAKGDDVLVLGNGKTLDVADLIDVGLC